MQIIQMILRERPLVALQSLDNRQYVPCCGGCFHFLGAARHHLMVCAYVHTHIREGVPTCSVPSHPLQSNISSQLLAEAADRSALGSPEAAAAQAEEAALFPESSFSPLVPCAMVRLLTYT